MSRIPQLREALVDAAARRASAGMQERAAAREQTERARRTIRHARRAPLVAAVLAAVLLTAAVALAASGLIQTGAPVRPLPGERFTPTTGFGVPIPATVRLLPISVRDPAGGPPWGVRYLRTTRGLACLQVGRVVGGRLGVLGQDGSFGDDGRFHELPPDVFEPLGCAPVDVRGHAFMGLVFHGLPASGVTDDLASQGCRQPVTLGAAADYAACPLTDERLVGYGLLGPDARSVTYRAGRATRTVPVARPLGAYLVVQRISRPASSLGMIVPMAGLGASPFTEVTYAGGAVCHIPPATRPGGARPCPRVGFVVPATPRLTPAQLAAPVTARVGPLAHIANPVFAHRPLEARRLHLTFRARVGVADADSRYLVELRSPGIAVRVPRSAAGTEDLTVEQRSGHFAGLCSRTDHSIRLSPVERDLIAGELVHVGLVLEPACPGRWSGRVIYLPANSTRFPRPGFGAIGPLPQRGQRDSLLVGRFSFVVR